MTKAALLEQAKNLENELGQCRAYLEELSTEGADEIVTLRAERNQLAAFVAYVFHGNPEALANALSEFTSDNPEMRREFSKNNVQPVRSILRKWKGNNDDRT